MPKVTIDGQTLEVEPGTTVITAAERLGIHVPRYCYFPGLSIAGSCRMCMVEIEKFPKLQIACYTQVTDGMVVHTNTEKVKIARQAILEFLLLNHPVDCPVCDQAGECWLQEYYMEYGLYNSTQAEDKIRKRKAVPIGPYVILDTERCILCSRCVRFCAEVTKTHEIGIFERGEHSEIWLYPGRNLDNKYSGNVIDICPVGALTCRDFRFQCRVWYLESVDSICPNCANGCNIEIHYNARRPHEAGGRRLLRLKPRYNPELNQWWMCDEGRYGYKFVDREDRILDPMERKEKGLSPITWKEAISRLAERLKTILNEGRPEQIGVIVSRWLTNEEMFLAKRLFGQELGVRNMDYRVPGNIVGEDDGFLIRADKSPNSKGAELIGLAGPDAAQIMEGAAAGRIKLLYVLGQDLVKGFGPELVKAAAEKTGLFVYQGTNLNDTTDFAHLVLPGAAFAEKEGTFTNYAGRVQKINQAFPPLGRSLPDGEIIIQLAQSLGLPYRARGGQELFQELAGETEAFKGFSYSQIGKSGSRVNLGV